MRSIPHSSRGTLFFFLYNKVNPSGVRQICHTTIMLFHISRGDVLFSQFEVPVAPKMFFVANGRLVYYIRGDTSIAKVNPRQWISEAVLWTTWAHHGSVVARSECELLTIDANRFVNITTSFQTLHANVYAARFVEALNDKSNAGVLSDLGEDTDCTRMLAADAFKEVDSELPVPDDWISRRRSTQISLGSYSEIASISSILAERGIVNRMLAALHMLGFPCCGKKAQAMGDDLDAE